MTKKCIVCSSLLVRVPGFSDERWKARKYCSIVCRNNRPIKKVKRVCGNCSKCFYVTPASLKRERGGKYCSQKCQVEGRRLRPIEKMRGRNHPSWSPSGRSNYNRLHWWIRQILGNPDTCEHCGETGLRGQQIHWANRSGEYRWDLDDWLRLCVPCHKRYDLERTG